MASSKNGNVIVRLSISPIVYEAICHQAGKSKTTPTKVVVSILSLWAKSKYAELFLPEINEMD